MRLIPGEPFHIGFLRREICEERSLSRLASWSFESRNGTQAASARYDYDPCINTGQASANYTRPYSGWAGIRQEASPGQSNYNGLQTALSYRTTHLQIMPAYTFSKALTTLGGRSAAAGGSLEGDVPQNYRNYAADYGPPSYDRTHVFTTSIVYDLPSPSQALLKQIVGGWTFAGLTILESGYALTPGLATSTAGLATRPNYAAPLHKVGSLTQWFSTSSFAAPALGFFGTASTGSIRGPAEFVGNAALYKSFPIYERVKLQFRAEAFNVANHTNFANVSTSLGSGNFGAVTSAQDPRILEFALRLTF